MRSWRGNGQLVRNLRRHNTLCSHHYMKKCRLRSLSEWPTHHLKLFSKLSTTFQRIAEATQAGSSTQLGNRNTETASRVGDAKPDKSSSNLTTASSPPEARTSGNILTQSQLPTLYLRTHHLDNFPTNSLYPCSLSPTSLLSSGDLILLSTRRYQLRRTHRVRRVQSVLPESYLLTGGVCPVRRP